MLGSILGALKAVVNVIGMTKMTPPIKDLLPRLTPILKNRHEKVSVLQHERLAFSAVFDIFEPDSIIGCLVLQIVRRVLPCFSSCSAHSALLEQAASDSALSTIAL